MSKGSAKRRPQISREEEAKRWADAFPESVTPRVKMTRELVSKCPVCCGTGREFDTNKVCSACQATGTKRTIQTYRVVKCPECAGAGVYPTTFADDPKADTECTMCGGGGTVEEYDV